MPAQKKRPVKPSSDSAEMFRYNQALRSLNKRLKCPVSRQEAKAIARVRRDLLKARHLVLKAGS